MVVGTLTGDKTVSVMAIAQKTLLRLICAVAITAVLTGSAAAQFQMPSINLEQEKHRTPEQIATRPGDRQGLPVGNQENSRSERRQ